MHYVYTRKLAFKQTIDPLLPATAHEDLKARVACTHRFSQLTNMSADQNIRMSTSANENTGAALSAAKLRDDVQTTRLGPESMTASSELPAVAGTSLAPEGVTAAILEAQRFRAERTAELRLGHLVQDKVNKVCVDHAFASTKAPCQI